MRNLLGFNTLTNCTEFPMTFAAQTNYGHSLEIKSPQVFVFLSDDLKKRENLVQFA